MCIGYDLRLCPHYGADKKESQSEAEGGQTGALCKCAAVFVVSVAVVILHSLASMDGFCRLSTQKEDQPALGGPWTVRASLEHCQS